MNRRTAPYTAGMAFVTACLFLVSVVVYAYADLPAGTQSLTGLAHRWVTEEMGYLPYTEPTTIEQDAVDTAVTALTAPPLGLINEADHGYAEAGSLIALAGSLSKAEPTIVGHEIIVWNDERAVRLYVSSDGLVKTIDAGTPQQLLVSHSAAATDQGGSDAVEIAKAAFDVASAVDPGAAPATNALVAAHYIGFADADGSHIVVRVGLGGETRYVEP